MVPYANLTIEIKGVICRIAASLLQSQSNKSYNDTQDYVILTKAMKIDSSTYSNQNNPHSIRHNNSTSNNSPTCTTPNQRSSKIQNIQSPTLPTSRGKGQYCSLYSSSQTISSITPQSSINIQSISLKNNGNIHHSKLLSANRHIRHNNNNNKALTTKKIRSSTSQQSRGKGRSQSVYNHLNYDSNNNHHSTPASTSKSPSGISPIIDNIPVVKKQQLYSNNYLTSSWSNSHFRSNSLEYSFKYSSISQPPPPTTSIATPLLPPPSTRRNLSVRTHLPQPLQLSHRCFHLPQPIEISIFCQRSNLS